MFCGSNRLDSVSFSPPRPGACAKLALAFLILSFTAHAQTQNLFFQPPTCPCSGQQVTADLRNDGKADLIGVSGLVALGNGDGTFTTGISWSVPGQIGAANSIATADFNGDGKQDLIVTFSSSTFLYVLLGNGDGTFQPAIGTNIGTSLSPVLVADVNSDGKKDVLGIGVGGALFVFLGKGDGTFSAMGPYSLSISTAQMVVGDFNGDGKLDLALGGYSATRNTGGPVGVLLGNGDGTFQPAVTSTGVYAPRAMAAGDVNGDGKLDLVIADDFIANGGTGQTFTLLGNGNGTFQAPSSPLAATGTTGTFALVDLNGDGKLDLIVASNPFADIFLGNGNGTFTLKHAYPFLLISPAVAWMVVAYFNDDGKLDIASANVLLIGNGDGSFQGNSATAVGQESMTAPGDAVLAVEGDFNNDGIPDVALCNQSNSGLEILLNDGTAAFSPAYTYTLPQLCQSIAASDLNGDGKLDLVITTIDSTTSEWVLNVLLGNGDGTFNSPTTSPQTQVLGPSGFPLLAIADFNGDHKPDIAIFLGNAEHTADLSNVTVFLNNGDGTFGLPVAYFSGSQTNSFVLADFNNDGKVDIAAAGAAGLGILLGKGDGTFLPVTFVNSNVEWISAVADLNRDGNMDLVTHTQVLPNSNQVLLGNGDGTFSPLPVISNVTTEGNVVDVVDVNGDGKLDLVFRFNGLRYNLGNGDGTFSDDVTILPAGPSGEGPNAEYTVAGSFLLTADFNRDGRTDIITDLSASNFSTSNLTGFITFLNMGQSPTPDFLISATSPQPGTIAPGSSLSSTITLTDIGGFSGVVALSCNGLPSGANCSFSPSSLNVSGATSALTITTTISTPVGSYPVIVTGSSAALTQSAAVALTVATSSGATTVAVDPRTLTFAPLTIGATSTAPAVVELTNTGTSALTISNISITGTNAGDFALQYNLCGTTLAAGASCQMNIVFSPTGTGTRNAAISVADNATGSPQYVSLTGTVTGYSFVPVAPCRVADTRGATGPFGGPTLTGGSTRSFIIPNSACGIPAMATAYSLNVTVVPAGSLGYISMWPTGQAQPLVSTLNSLDGRVKANAAIVPAGTGGAVSVFASDATNVILDINGYFVPTTVSSALAFYPVTPCRVADTRSTTGALGGPSLAGGQTRSFPVLSACGIPSTAQAYSLNFTAIPQGTLGYLTVWPSGQTQPFVSTLNVPTGAVTANAAIVPAGSGGLIETYVTDNTNLVIDINGYFAPPGPGRLSLYPLAPCRVLDTRQNVGAFSGTLNVNVTGSGCGVPGSAQAYVFNATVVPPGALGFLTLWSSGGTQPVVSTLNALDGALTSNMAVVPAASGSVSGYASNATQLILDISGYFAP